MSTKPLPKDGPAAPESIVDMFKKFQVVQNRVLRWMLPIFPWIVVLAAGYASQMNPPPLRVSTKLLYWGYSAAICYALILIALQILMKRIPKTLRHRWDQNTIMTKERQISPGNTAKDSSYVKEYEQFIHDVEKLLNDSRGQWGLGLVLTLVFRTIFLYIAVGPVTMLYVEYLINYGRWFEWFLELLIPLSGFLMGAVLWRVSITGVRIWRRGTTS